MNNINNSQSCCFFGHRKIVITDLLLDSLNLILEDLIINKNVNTFIFGSKSEFDDLCLDIVTKLKEKYPYIKRIYIRAEYPYIDDHYRNYLLKSYEDTYYPERIIGAGKAVYVERNYATINSSNYCIIYYNETATENYKRRSGTKLAYEYAKRRNLNVINVFK